MQYDVDFNALTWQYLPTELREEVVYAWLKSNVSPVVYLKGLFDLNRQANLYTLAHNGQVCYLEAVLNDLFDTEARRIFISDSTGLVDPDYIYQTDEDKPVYLYQTSEHEPVYLYQDSELADTGVQFVVNVPNAVTTTAGYNINRLKSIVNFYKLPGKSWTVQLF